MQLIQVTFALCITLVGLQSVISGPVSRRDVWSGGQLSVNRDSLCFELPQEIADYCNYSHTLLPNPKGHTTIDAARREFDDFTRLINSNCSVYLGTFLCFYYFPLSPNCNGREKRNANNAHGVPPPKILPCKETCLAAKSDTCTRFIESSPVGGWPQHLNCDLRQDVATSNGLCAYGNNTSVYVPNKAVPTFAPVTNSPEKTKKKGPKELEGSGDEETPADEKTKAMTESPSVDSMTPTAASTDEKTKAMTESPSVDSMTPTAASTDEKTKAMTESPSVDSKTPTAASTDEKTKAMTESPSVDSMTPTAAPPKCKKCDARENANGGTFVRNKYTFAARVSNVRNVASMFGRHAYEVTVGEVFGVQTCNEATNELDPALSMGSTVIIYGNYAHCSPIPEMTAKVGTDESESILVAGFHEVDSDGAIRFNLDCDMRPLVAPWTRKLNRKLNKFVTEGNNAREQKCQDLVDFASQT